MPCEHDIMPIKTTDRLSWVRVALVAMLLVCVATSITLSAAHGHKNPMGSEHLGHCSLCMMSAQLVSNVAVVVSAITLFLLEKKAEPAFEVVSALRSRERHAFRVRPPPSF